MRLLAAILLLGCAHGPLYEPEPDDTDCGYVYSYDVRLRQSVVQFPALTTCEEARQWVARGLTEGQRGTVLVLPEFATWDVDAEDFVQRAGSQFFLPLPDGGTELEILGRAGSLNELEHENCHQLARETKTHDRCDKARVRPLSQWERR